MKLIYRGTYTGEKDLPQRKHPEGAVAFRELSDMKKMAIVLNLLSLPLFALTIGGFVLRAQPYLADGGWGMTLGWLTPLLVLFPHELLHAICFYGEVELWTNFKMGLLFVVGTEDMTRTRFLFMSLLPNLVFGWIPYLLFLLRPEWLFLGSMGAINIPMGIGDYYNMYNCMTQVPKGAAVYLSGMHSYWYQPGEHGLDQ